MVEKLLKADAIWFGFLIAYFGANLWCPLVFIYQDLTLPPDYELDYELGSPPGVMAEEVHLLWDLVAQRLFLASLHHSLAFNHQWQ